MITVRKHFNLWTIFATASFLILTLTPSMVLAQEKDEKELGAFIVNPSIEFFEFLGPKVAFKNVLLRSRLLTDTTPWRKVRLLSPSDSAHQYLESHNWKLDIYQVYPSAENPYEMPSFVIYASTTNPLQFDILKERMGLGEILISKLFKAGKVEKGQLIENIRFYAIDFEKIESGVFRGNVKISGWIPTFMFKK